MRLFTIAMVTVLVLSGCGGGDGTDQPSDVSGEELTMQDFIPGAIAFDEENAEQQYLQMEREAQEQIASCMAEQGFEYIPYVQSQDMGGFVGPESQEEFVELYGFGIATMMLEEQQMDEAAMEEEMAKDPNNAIVEAMPEEEQQEYYAALHGAEPDIDYESMTEEEIDEFYQSWVPEGCWNDAYEELYGGGEDMAFWEEFGPLMDDMYRDLDSDPRIVDLEATWSACMADQGYDFGERFDVDVYLLRRLEEVGAISDLDIEGDGMGYGYGGSEEPIEPGSPMAAVVQEIADEEILIAKADLACSADQEKVWQEVYQEAEQRFIEENRAELEQFKSDHS